MIAVIADDLSGAAELANAAVEAGFSAEVQIGNAFIATDAEVVCVDTQTRSLSSERAAAIAETVAATIAGGKPALVYKKCDSVLRGWVAVESLAIARALGRRRVLLVPANPTRQRIIRGGKYFIDGVPLEQTAFADDPEYPRRSSRVAELVGTSQQIEIPDTVSASDLERHSKRVDGGMLPAGGVDFFNTLLRARFPRSTESKEAAADWATGSPSLFVCGSLAAWLGGRREQFADHGIATFPMPAELYGSPGDSDLNRRWADAATAALRTRGSAALAIGHEPSAAQSSQEALLSNLAEAVRIIMDGVPVARVFLEGGATASAVVGRLGLARFRAQRSPGAGVGALVPVSQSRPLFLMKPGSYLWPDNVLPRPLAA